MDSALCADAPPGDEGARDRRVGQLDRDRIVGDAPNTARGHHPTIRPRILVEPFLHLIEAQPVAVGKADGPLGI